MEIFWLKEESLEDSENLPDPAVPGTGDCRELDGVLAQFRGIQDELDEANDASLTTSRCF
jgi:type I restriction enzyme M protein